MAEHINAGSSAAAARQFIKAYMDAPGDADIEVAVCKDEGGSPEIACRIVGGLAISMTPAAAATFMDVLEDAGRTFPNFPEAQVFANLILGVRAAIARATV